LKKDPERLQASIKGILFGRVDLRPKFRASLVYYALAVFVDGPPRPGRASERGDRKSRYASRAYTFSLPVLTEL